MAAQHIYKIIFHNRDQVYEIYARRISQGTLFGFVEVEELSFGETSKIVVDPGAEKLAAEFNGVKRSYIPLHTIVRIDEVAREGVAKMSTVKSGSVTTLPIYTPGKPGTSE